MGQTFKAGASSREICILDVHDLIISSVTCWNEYIICRADTFVAWWFFCDPSVQYKICSQFANGQSLDPFLFSFENDSEVPVVWGTFSTLT